MEGGDGFEVPVGHYRLVTWTPTGHVMPNTNSSITSSFQLITCADLCSKRDISYSYIHTYIHALVYLSEMRLLQVWAVYSVVLTSESLVLELRRFCTGWECLRVYG